LLTLVFALVLVLVLIGFSKLNASQSNPVANVKVAGTPDQLARGGKLAAGCAGCHSSTQHPPLDGGTANFLAGGPPLGVVYGPNLTPGGELNGWSDGEIIRAIREGVDQAGRSLLIMPSAGLRNLSDSDVQAIVAYLRSQPAVKHDVPETSMTVLGALFVGAGLFQTSAQPRILQPVVAPPTGVTTDYGKYLVSFSGCDDCHGENLAGGKPGGFAPVGPNLTKIGSAWSETDFVKALRTGVKSDGKAFAPEMPWQEFSAMYSDDELKAIFAYFKSLPPVQ
jgi:mono/diheme cytochrome c family protein